MTRRPSNLSGRVASVTLPVPVRPRGGDWTLKPIALAVYAGEEQTDAAAFAVAIRRSFAAHRAAWLDRPAPDGTFVPIPNANDRGYQYGRAVGR